MAKTLVDDGIKYIREYGQDRAFSTFNDQKGRFVKDDLYLFVLDFNGKTIVHGANSALIGKNLYHVKDEDGKKIFREMIEIARERDSGWVEYKWSHPETKEIMNKTAYIYKIPGQDNLIGCGSYNG